MQNLRKDDADFEDTEGVGAYQNLMRDVFLKTQQSLLFCCGLLYKRV